MGLAKRPNPLVIGVSVAAVVLVAVTRLAPPLELGRDDAGATHVAVARANHALIAANMAASRIAADQGGAFTADAECRWEFVKYIPSSTETRWFKRLQADLQSACAMTTGDFRRELYDGVYQNKRSMTPDDLRHVKTLPTNCTGTLPDMDVLRKQKDIFSLFEFKNSCTNETHFSPIEPLAGPLRHPALCNQGRSDSDVIRKDWLVVDPWVAQQAEKTRAKKRYFDAGASTWLGDVSGASQAWFWAMYGQMCVQFDSFHCWEKKNHDATNFFSEIPAAVRPKYHFYNTPATTSAKDGNSPVFHLLSEATKDDFVVFKLDIDHTETEEKIVDSLLANPKALELIDEFFWEHHVKFQSMSFAWGWDANMQMQDATIKYLTAMRQVGVRAHSWV